MCHLISSPSTSSSGAIRMGQDMERGPQRPHMDLDFLATQHRTCFGKNKEKTALKSQIHVRIKFTYRPKTSCVSVVVFFSLFITVPIEYEWSLSTFTLKAFVNSTKT